MNEQKTNIWTRLGPIIVLYVLSPAVAEVLSGSTPVSRFNGILIESLIYGSGALLIRELVRRLGLGWISIIALGIAFGLIEEGLMTQSIFNENFMNFHIGLGRIWGVNTAFALIIIGNHSIYSITIPILLAELIFRNRRKENWLSITGIIVASVLYLLGGIAIAFFFHKSYGFSTTLIHYIITIVLIIGFIALAIKLPVTSLLKHSLKTPPALVIGSISLVASFIWLILLSLVFKNDVGMPAWLLELLGILILAFLFYLVWGWVNSNWNDIHKLFLAIGVSYSGMIFGLLILIPANNMLDIYSQIIFILIMSLIYIVIGKKLALNK